MTLFKVNNISKSFGGVHAVQDLSFEVNPGEIFSIIGPNGAGKSTIFNCICGLYRPEKGGIYMQEQNLVGKRPDQIAKMGIARTFQNLELFKYMTSLDNIMLGRHPQMPISLWQIPLLLFKKSKAAQEEVKNRRKAEEIIEFLEIEAYRDHPVFALPYGIQKLVELGRALASAPQLLLLDEPAAGLNNEERQDMIFWIKDICLEMGITVIVIEHNMQLVKDISDRIMAINFGKRIATGPVQEVLDHEEVIKAYLGETID